MKNWSSEIQELNNYYQALSGKIPDLEKELERLIKVEDEIGVLVSSRRCLEVMVNDLCEKESIKLGKTIPLKGIIDKLNKENRVPAHIITTMLNLNSSSTYGAHPKEFDQRQVRTVLINLTTIVEWYLKYIDSKEGIKSEEETKPEGKRKIEVVKDKDKPRKRLWIMLSGVLAIIVVVLLVFNFIDGTKQDQSITELEKSIAILPFDNMSPDQDNQYFADGVMDAILNHLAKIEAFRVISRTTMERYRDHKKSMPDIGKELGVSYILEGSAQKYGDEIRITVQLIQAATDEHIWSNEYTREFKDIFSLQSNIAQRVARELKITLNTEVKDRIEAIPTNSMEAYELYLLGKAHLLQYNFEKKNIVVEYFQKAIELDSNFALAYSGIARYNLARGYFAGDLNPDEAYQKTLPYLNKALELDQNLSEAHVALGWIKVYYEWNFEGGEKEYLEAIRLNPNDYWTTLCYIDLLNNLERHEEALYWYEKASEKASYIDNNPNYYALTLFYLNRTNEAIQVLKENLALNPGSHSYSFLGFCLLNSGKYEEAIYAQKKALDLAGIKIPRMMAWLAASYAKNGQKDLAIELMEELKLMRGSSLVGSPSFFIAVIYSSLDEKELAFQWLEKAFDDHDMEMVWLKTEPQLYPLHDDPMFQDLAKRVGFPE